MNLASLPSSLGVELDRTRCHIQDEQLAMIPRAMVRTFVGFVLATDADFDAFCGDYFPEIASRFSRGMDRLEKTNHLLTLAPEDTLLSSLRKYAPKRYATHAKKLNITAEAPADAPAEESPSNVSYLKRGAVYGLLTSLTIGGGFIAIRLNAPVPAGMVRQSGGAFTIVEPYKDARHVAPYLLDRHEVTARDFSEWLHNRDGVQMIGQEMRDRDNELLLDMAGVAVKSQGPNNLPVSGVTYIGATRYCEAHGKRLPRYEEWDLAARGADQMKDFPWGEQPPSCAAVVFARNRARGGDFAICAAAGPPGPADVGTAALDRTADEVRDLAGNVSEWVQGAGNQPYARGGSWARDIAGTRTSYYVKLSSGLGFPDVGFRCAKDIAGFWRWAK